jgi:hypothetical protein
MWILPRPLHTSPYVPDTEALISDSEEFCQLCAQSLTARGKDSAARTWSAKLKRDSWMQLLFGRTLRPSHGSSFTAAWTSSVAATRASRSRLLASASAPKTQDTSGRLLQPELLQCDQVPVFLRMSRDISALGFPTCCKTWQEWVTERRGAWRQRVNAARLTRGKGSSSWRTPTEAETHNQDYSSQTYLQNQVQPNWPTASARDHKDCSDPATWDCKEKRNRYDQLGRAVFKNAANWPTVQTTDSMGACLTAKRLSRPKGTQLREAVHGQAAPASSSSLGSRQELWRTPSAQLIEAKADGIKLSGRTPQDPQVGLADQVRAQWATPQAHDAQGPKTPEQIAAMRAKGHGVKNLNEMVAGNWPTVTSSDYRTPPTNSGLDGQAIMPSSEHALPKAAGGKLNPRWVETLMGLPIGWTMPSCTSPQIIAPTSCDSSATESCLPPQSELSEFSLAS